MWRAGVLLGVQRDVVSFCLLWFGGWPQICGLYFYFPGLVLYQIQRRWTAEAEVQRIPAEHCEWASGPAQQSGEICPDYILPSLQLPGGISWRNWSAKGIPGHYTDLSWAFPRSNKLLCRSWAGREPQFCSVASLLKPGKGRHVLLVELNMASWETPVPSYFLFLKPLQTQSSNQQNSVLTATVDWGLDTSTRLIAFPSLFPGQSLDSSVTTFPGFTSCSCMVEAWGPWQTLGKAMTTHIISLPSRGRWAWPWLCISKAEFLGLNTYCGFRSKAQFASTMQSDRNNGSVACPFGFPRIKQMFLISGSWMFPKALWIAFLSHSRRINQVEKLQMLQRTVCHNVMNDNRISCHLVFS